jgi:four helix bundle protein
MVLNLAEGAAEFSAAEKARFYRMSRRSSAECIAALDLVLIEAPEATGIDAAQEGLEQVMAMVTTLIHAMERRRGGNRSGIEG